MNTARHAAPVKATTRRPRGRRTYSKRARHWVIAAIAFLCVAGLLLISGGIYIWVMFSRVNYGDEEGSFVDSLLPDDSEFSDDVTSDYTIIDNGAQDVADIPVRENTQNITNILLLGIDSNSGSDSAKRKDTSYSGRADTTIILTINKKDKTIKLTSIMRDSLVTIPGRDWNGDGNDDYSKFNAAYAYGGFDLLSKTIEQNYRLKINKYVAINFAFFAQAVDAMGGVKVDMSAAEAKATKMGSTEGSYQLNGQKALLYSRLRYNLGDDYGRTNRQRKMITALITKAKTMSIGKLNSVLYDVLPNIRTNMSMNEFLNFTTNSLTYANYAVGESFQMPPNGEHYGDKISGIGSVLVLKDAPKTVTELHQFIYASPDNS